MTDPTQRSAAVSTVTRFLSSPVAKIDVGLHYKWIALSNTTIGILMATINSSIVLISLPAIFRGIKLNPLARATSATCSGC